MAEHLFGDGLELQVRRAFVDLADLRVAIQLFDRVVLHEAVAAVQIDGERRDALGDLRREELAHRGLGEKRLAGVAQPRRVVDQQPRRLEVGRGARDLVLHRLEVGDRACRTASARSCTRSRDRARPAPGRSSARRSRSVPRSAFRSRPCSLCRPRRARARRHAALLEEQLAGAARADAELVFLLADGEPRRLPLDDERGDPAVPGVGIDSGEDDEEAGFVGVGDPELAAVQDPVARAVARFARARAQRERVAAGAGFRQGVRADRVGRELRQIALLDVLAAPAKQRVDDQRVLHVDEHANRRDRRATALRPPAPRERSSRRRRRTLPESRCP